MNDLFKDWGMTFMWVAIQLICFVLIWNGSQSMRVFCLLPLFFIVLLTVMNIVRLRSIERANKEIKEMDELLKELRGENDGS